MRAPPTLLTFLLFILIVPSLVFATPVINSVEYPQSLILGDTATIRANITDNATMDKVLVNFTYPMNETFEMTHVNGSIYEFNYTPNLAKTFVYNIFANDSDGNFTISPSYSFSVRIKKEVVISVEIAPMCGAGFEYYYVPDKVIRGMTVLFLQINNNVGNVDINETSTMYVKNDTTIVMSPISDQTVLLKPWESDPHFGFWVTNNETKPGIYYWHGITEFESDLNRGNKEYPWPAYNETANCTKPEDIDGDGRDEVTCIYMFPTECYNTYGRKYVANTTTVSSLRIQGESPNSTTYYSKLNISNTTYYAYTFKMENCSEYCYACFSEDQNLTSNECTYEQGWPNAGWIMIKLGNFTIPDLSSDGKKVTFTETYRSCVNRSITSECEVSYTTHKLNCTDRILCSGSLEIVKDFKVITQFGNKTEIQPQPQPQPQPTPEPTPQPQPQPLPKEGKGAIKINIEPIDLQVKGMQEKYTPVRFTIENVGGTQINNLTIKSVIGEDWIANESYIDTIKPGEKLNRTLFIKPTYKVSPSTYAIPTQVIARNGDILDMTYFWFEVIPGEFLSKVKIVESPSEIMLDSNSWQTIPILVKNIGKKPLTGVSARLENIENCIVNQSSSEIKLDVDEEKTLNLKVKTKTGPESCRAFLIVNTDQDAYAFTRMTIKVSPPKALIPGGIPLTSLLTLIFVIILFILITLRRRGKYSGALIPIVISITAILLVYMLLWYLGFVPLF